MRLLMIRRTPRGVVAACAVMALAASAHADEDKATNLGQALKDGKVSLELRYRFETVADDAFDDDGDASTLRTVLGFRTLAWHRFTGFVEFQNVADLGLGDAHNNGGAGSYGNGVTDRPVIPDPEITSAHQYGLRTTWVPRTELTLGRQEIALSNERFVGPVGFRQNHQSFVALRADAKPLEHLRLTYAYLDRVHTPTGAAKSMGTHTARGEFDVGRAGTAAFYALWLHYSAPADAALSTDTFGVEWSGVASAGSTWSVPYHAEWAHQEDAAANPVAFSVDYVFGEVGVKSRRFEAHLGMERLGSDSGIAGFGTPLATLHKFNGWADKFAATPATGLVDLWLSIAGKGKSWSWLLACHEFSPDTAGADYGREVDGRLEWHAPWKQVVGGELAVYNKDEFSTDTTKLWLYTRWGF